MKRLSRFTWAVSAVLVVCFTASVLLLQRVDAVRGPATLEEVLLISSPEALKRMSLGYDGLLADVYWTRAVQYFGGKHRAGDEHLQLLAPLLEITTTLDPHLIVAYEFGANFLGTRPPNGAGEPEKAVELAKFGIRNNPREWRLYYQLGFIYYTDLQDYSNAARAFSEGSQLPNAHPWLKVLAAQMAQHAGEIQTARMLWTATYQTSTDRSIRANAAAHLRALQCDEEVTAIEGLIARYRGQTGRYPKNFAEMVAGGLLRGVPVDPVGRPFLLTPDGRVEVGDPDSLPFIQKGLPPGYVPPKKPKFLPSD